MRQDNSLLAAVVYQDEKYDKDCRRRDCRSRRNGIEEIN
nr:MAG TPA: hypothetical protein [Caudoviricetes sp.]